MSRLARQNFLRAIVCCATALATMPACARGGSNPQDGSVEIDTGVVDSGLADMSRLDQAVELDAPAFDSAVLDASIDMASVDMPSTDMGILVDAPIDALLDGPRMCVTAGDCNDIRTCTVDTCEGGFCVNTVPEGACDDGNPCTTDACAVHACAHLANADACDDGNACTLGDRCSTSTATCQPGPPRDCSGCACNTSTGVCMGPCA